MSRAWRLSQASTTLLSPMSLTVSDLGISSRFSVGLMSSAEWLDRASKESGDRIARVSGEGWRSS